MVFVQKGNISFKDMTPTEEHADYDGDGDVGEIDGGTYGSVGHIGFVEEVGDGGSLSGCPSHSYTCTVS